MFIVKPHAMRRAAWFVAIGGAGIGVVAAAALLLFEVAVVSPALAKAQCALAAAAPSERALPVALQEMLLKSPGATLKYHVARQLLSASPSQVEGLRTTRRQLTELGVGLLLPLHLSESELMSLFATQSFMGVGVKGFARASAVYLNTPLEQINSSQTARLVAISHAPSAYLANPERLERRIQFLLSEGHE